MAQAMASFLALRQLLCSRLPSEVMQMVATYWWLQNASPGDLLSLVTRNEGQVLFCDLPYGDALKGEAGDLVLAWESALKWMLNNHYLLEAASHFDALQGVVDAHPQFLKNLRALDMDFSEASELEQFCGEFIPNCPHLQSVYLGLESLRWRDYRQYLRSLPNMPVFHLGLDFMSPASIHELYEICQQRTNLRLLKFSIRSETLETFQDPRYDEIFLSSSTTLKVQLGMDGIMWQSNSLREMCTRCNFKLVLEELQYIQYILFHPEFDVIFDRTTGINLSFRGFLLSMLYWLDARCLQNQSIRLVVTLPVRDDSSSEQDSINFITQSLLEWPHVIGAIDEFQICTLLFPELVRDIDSMCARNPRMRVTLENIVGGFQHLEASALIPSQLTRLESGLWAGEGRLETEEEVQVLRRVLQNGLPELTFQVVVDSRLIKPLVGLESPKMELIWVFNGSSYDLVCRRCVWGLAIRSEKVLIEDTLAMAVGQGEWKQQLRKPAFIDDEEREVSLKEYSSLSCLHLAWCNPWREPTDEWVHSLASTAGEYMPAL